MYLPDMNSVGSIASYLEKVAPPSLQEDYDNAGLITGSPEMECSGIICALDVTEEVVLEAIQKKCNLIVAHHPVIFRGLKKINGKNQVERTVILAVKNDIAIYSVHTNLDNIMEGVNGKIASRLGLTDLAVLSEKQHTLQKLFTFVPLSHAEEVRRALFEAGGGYIGNYSSCSFNVEGTGTFKGEEGTHPFAGEPGKLHTEKEVKTEIVFPAFLQSKIVGALKESHPYEEVAYDIIALKNSHPGTGSGITGMLPGEMGEQEFLAFLKEVFGLPVIRHTAFTGRKIKKIAVCGGAGSFLISSALSARVEAFITADMKYHEFFEADKKLLIADIGHYESEQFTIELLHELLTKKFPNFAVLKTGVITNPVHYFR